MHKRKVAFDVSSNLNYLNATENNYSLENFVFDLIILNFRNWMIRLNLNTHNVEMPTI